MHWKIAESWYFPIIFSKKFVRLHCDSHTHYKHCIFYILCIYLFLNDNLILKLHIKINIGCQIGMTHFHFNNSYSNGDRFNS